MIFYKCFFANVILCLPVLHLFLFSIIFRSEQIIKKCGRRFNYIRPDMPDGIKDIGDLTVEQIKELIYPQIKELINEH